MCRTRINSIQFNHHFISDTSLNETMLRTAAKKYRKVGRDDDMITTFIPLLSKFIAIEQTNDKWKRRISTDQTSEEIKLTGITYRRNNKPIFTFENTMEAVMANKEVTEKFK